MSPFCSMLDVNQGLPLDRNVPVMCAKLSKMEHKIKKIIKGHQLDADGLSLPVQ